MVERLRREPHRQAMNVNDCADCATYPFGILKRSQKKHMHAGVWLTDRRLVDHGVSTIDPLDVFIFLQPRWFF